MAFGITREELQQWKKEVSAGNISFITHFWLHPRYPGITSVTKVGCSDIEKLRSWAISHGLPPGSMHDRESYPHYDLIGTKQQEILQNEGRLDQLRRFVLKQP